MPPPRQPASAAGAALAALALLTWGAGCGDRATPADPLRVATEGGVVRGTSSGGARRFLGIPYAAPPVGARRWRAPEAREPWSGELDATAIAPACPQTIPVLNAVVDADEDCLTLNVVTRDPAPERAPVLVWLHGGGFTSRDSLFGRVTLGDRLAAEHDVVVVSVHYRLGALGFLAHPALAEQDHRQHPSSGNYGLEDQAAALAWVQRNVAAFGGDPAKVTLFGQSAGGWSVCAHLAADGSRGLFARAIVQSGVCTVPLPTRAQAEAQGVRLAAAVGCEAADDVAACLRDVPAAELLRALEPDPSIFLLEGDWALWRPVIDGAVLREQIADTFAGGRAAQVPVVLGANADEGTFFVLAAHEYRGEPLDAALYPERLRVVFGDALADAVAARYPLADFASPAAALAAAVGDGIVSCPTFEGARVLAERSPVWAYQLEVRDLPYVLGPPRLLAPGAFHSAELPLVFGVPEVGTFAPAIEQLSARVRAAWTSFARSGDPNGRGAPAWPRFTAGDEAYLALAAPPRAAVRPRGEACDFWRTLDLGRAPLL